MYRYLDRWYIIFAFEMDEGGGKHPRLLKLSECSCRMSVAAVSICNLTQVDFEPVVDRGRSVKYLFPGCGC